MSIHSTASNHSGLRFGFNSIFGTSSSGAENDNTVDFGSPNLRFKDIYLGGEGKFSKARSNTLGQSAIKILPSDTVVGYGFRMEQTNNDLVVEKSAPSGSELEIARFKVGGGIALGGTGTANTLDDYEEGTYTAGVFDANSGGNQSSTTATGYYTKIGRLVNFNVAFNDINTTGLTGSNRIFVSLPFVSINGQTDAQTSPFVKKFSFGGYLIFGESSGSQKSRFGFISINNAASQTSTTVSDVTDDDNYCSISLTYFTD
jgi:hypothetical protein